MNPFIEEELQQYIEQIIRSVHTTKARKCLFREELFTHLQTAYEEELQKDCDEHAAMIRAKERFGDPREIASQGNVAFFLLSHRGELMMLHRLLWLALLFTLVGLGFICPQLAQLQMQGYLASGGIGLLMMGSFLTLLGIGSGGYSVWRSRQL